MYVYYMRYELPTLLQSEDNSHTSVINDTQ